MASGASIGTHVFLDKTKVADRCGKRFCFEEIFFMAGTFFGTFAATYHVAPKIIRRQFRASEAALYAAPATMGAIISYLLTDPDI